MNLKAGFKNVRFRIRRDEVGDHCVVIGQPRGIGLGHEMEAVSDNSHLDAVHLLLKDSE
jgi:hypothetical protein